MRAIAVSLGLALVLAGSAAPVVTGTEPSPSGQPLVSPAPSTPPAEVPNVGRPLTTDELLAVRADLAPVRRPVALVAEASIDLEPDWVWPVCRPDRVCALGALVTTNGSMPVVLADRTVRQLYQRSRDSIDGVLAFELRGYGLRFLGRVALPPGGSLVQPVSPDMMTWADEINAGELIAVDGWLSVLGWGVPCPGPSPELVADENPDDSPFVRCPAGWISGRCRAAGAGPRSGADDATRLRDPGPGFGLRALCA